MLDSGHWNSLLTEQFPRQQLVMIKLSVHCSDSISFKEIDCDQTGLLESGMHHNSI